MVTHIVMWKLKAENKEANKLEMREQLLALKDKIVQLNEIRVEFNLPEADAGNCDVMLFTKFENFEDLDIYAKHPEHLKVVSFIKSVVEQRVAIDY
ncbi:MULTISPECIES: Dabb family protein [Myroides]|uniref:Dabb family protein n=1 Tax=Myroides albus TaxID=2562892 RepID=A0A6I3LBC8_9FLAO|nr:MULTISPECIES: Dabb family protein [Myroides]MTG96759.1 Dabb family protein [Myroides albus]MVX35600.1 Dabb family protein [Myroides sp. LoEW2-1]UVD80830.1 Dabb family protein [Myroides albus]